MRLLKSHHFKYVFFKPFKLEISEMIILGRLNSLQYSRLGLSISKKNIKHAYQRNYLKRLMREGFRLSQHKIIGIDFLIIAKKNAMRLNIDLCKKMLEKVWCDYHQ
ncbi:MAG TPA: ribonuclease P protein component [Buchnera sp. (in: enterobacteria)]|nr:ribonuclease P protein component [Buchnera sp. (in: enterobacteria)]